MKSQIVFSAAIVALLTTVLIAASPTTKPDHGSTPEQATGPWHVTALPAGGQSMGQSEAILWNNETGESWVWTGSGRFEWTPLKR